MTVAQAFLPCITRRQWAPRNKAALHFMLSVMPLGNNYGAEMERKVFVEQGKLREQSHYKRLPYADL